MAAAGKADLASEPSMEDLLASIRRAITDDVNQAAGVRPAAVQAGADRQSFRAKLEESIANDKAALDARQGEILELRGKVAGQLAQGASRFDAARFEPPAERRNGFAGLLGGEAERREPPLRQSIQDDDYGHARREPEYRAYQRPEPEPRMWQPEEPQIRQRPETPPQFRLGYEPQSPGVMSPGPSAQANAAFNQLAETLMARALGDRSIEQMTQDLLRGMLRQWLDDNLPPMVERLVREEIERVARRGPAR